MKDDDLQNQNEVRRLLGPFYFGSVNEDERLRVEQELLLDSEVLVDFLDLKRKIESASEIPAEPSRTLWRRLSTEIKPRRKMIFAISLAVGVAASVFLALIFFSSKGALTTRESGGLMGNATNGQPVLFDSGGELSSGANVL